MTDVGLILIHNLPLAIVFVFIFTCATIVLVFSHISLPQATLDLSNGVNGTLTAQNLELSTLV